MQALELAQLISPKKCGEQLLSRIPARTRPQHGTIHPTRRRHGPTTCPEPVEGSPHTEDEVYYVVNGLAKIRAGEEDCDVKAGSIIYLAKNMEHRFHSIEEELTVLVFFAPAEYSNKKGK